MADDPALTLLGRLVDLSDRRRIARSDFYRQSLAAARVAKRALANARRAVKDAEDAYKAQALRVLKRPRVVVHNADEILAVVALLAAAQRPHVLERVLVHGPIPVGNAIDPLVQEMRDLLEVHGFVWHAGNTYTIPPPEEEQQQEA